MTQFAGMSGINTFEIATNEEIEHFEMFPSTLYGRGNVMVFLQKTVSIFTEPLVLNRR